MGNRFSRRRETPASKPETLATEQKTAKEPAKDSEVTQTQEVTKSENLDVVVEEQVTPVACLPSEECVSECKEAEPSAASGPSTEPALVVKEAPTPVEPEPQVSASKPSPPEPVAEAQFAPVPEPVPSSNPDGDTEVVQPISEPVPAPVEHLEVQTDQLTQESLLESIVSSPPLTDLGIPDVTPIPVPDEPSDPTDGEKCQDSDETTDNSMFEPEKSADTHLEKPVEVEAEECLEKLGSDVNEENFSDTLKNLELKGNDLVSDLIPSDANIPDDTPITDMSTSTELM
ncbi:uncharacterized protein LOC115781828 [Archocentrus centrarchus]|uniref:uncharacterized protein LOC115781828 n=1 Tax=Archocentrus centrarchus TaxID=63155 RepID=UPI0011E9C47B|nr:uncharacterized protein LOC115781828 [Archocentrus centrarchus]